MKKTTWETIKDMLLSTQREGMSELIEYLERVGFTTAPCSGGNHLCKEGGLMEHSLNVCTTALSVAYGRLGDDLTDTMKNSVIITSLLHDVGKCGDFGQPLYIPNILKSGKQSDSKPFERNKALPLYQEHAVMSLLHVTRYIYLTPEEEHAIRYHDGLYERYNSNYAGSETWLSMIVHFADLWASRIIESEGNDNV